ncbi:MAG TPA: N-6 DNA methylase [Candidatus Saccharimonadales bacterium]|nr:N-6 DNA methylase [Candidatus Saccharimonadales bacterium]
MKEVFLETFPARPELERNLDSLPTRSAWNLVSIYLTARSGGQCLPRFGIQEAEIWFRGGSHATTTSLSAQIPAGRLWQAEQLLNGIQFDSEFRALLPYILEEHGPGSRASVMKNAATASSRAAKRQGGVFYTPADVAEYMVEQAGKLYSGDFLTAKCLDPACGTGVFLLAMLRSASRWHDDADGFTYLDYITSCFHGLDVSGHALDAAAFILLQECLSELPARRVSPLAAWKLIRRNLVEADALRVDSKQTSTELFENPLPHLRQLFSNVSNGFGILVGNPPYAAIGERQDFDSLTPRFTSLSAGKVTQRANLYPLFVEMMWRFTTPGRNAAALVTPLSIAYHGGAQYENCRHAMSWTGGHWQFAFFDREPHALFGEEVKTRNAILFRFESTATPRRGEAANIETGPLRKWTSRTRASLFQTINFTEVDSVDITTGIPKLGGFCQAEAFMALMLRLDRLPSLPLRIGTCPVAEALSGEKSPKSFCGRDSL